MDEMWTGVLGGLVCGLLLMAVPGATSAQAEGASDGGAEAGLERALQSDVTLISGQLEAKPTEQLVCTVINKGEDEVYAEISLELAAGGVLAGPIEPRIAPEAAERLVFLVPAGSGVEPGVVARCRAVAPAESTLSGNLRVSGPSTAESRWSPLQARLPAAATVGTAPSPPSSPATRDVGSSRCCGRGFEQAWLLPMLVWMRRWRS